jgi:haloalkane dehalogenase
MSVLRTPEERFADLPDFPHEPTYREWESIRLAHVDVGDGAPVVLLHGEPSWSFLWRHVIAELVDAGHRCIAPDLAGFGRSDKPADGWYSLAGHVRSIASLLETLDLRDVTLVVHDFGGPIGLQAAALEVPDRIARIVAMDTGVLTGEQDLGPAWHAFKDHVAAHPDLPVGDLIAANCSTPPTDAVRAAYDAPFPGPEHKAGPRSFPPMVPLTPDAPGAAAQREAAMRLVTEPRPSLLLWADADPIIPLESIGRAMQPLFPMAGDVVVVEGAGHFLQEDQGAHIGRLIADWLASA